MHGCVTSDVWWLARDFGFRVASVFDTQEFAKYVESNKASQALSALWLQYCDGLFDVNIFSEKEKF